MDIGGIGYPSSRSTSPTRGLLISTTRGPQPDRGGIPRSQHPEPRRYRPRQSARSCLTGNKPRQRRGRTLVQQHSAACSAPKVPHPCGGAGRAGALAMAALNIPKTRRPARPAEEDAQTAPARSRGWKGYFARRAGQPPFSDIPVPQGSGSSLLAFYASATRWGRNTPTRHHHWDIERFGLRSLTMEDTWTSGIHRLGAI